MFSRLLKAVPAPRSLSQSFSRFFSASKLEPGNLYTWGASTSSLGYPVPAAQQKVANPTKVDAFNGNVVKVVMGQTHSAVITTEGELYTFGSSQHGCLGHNNESNQIQPKLVEFFQKHGLKVTDVAIGERHTVALTDDGDVFSWGYGGKSRNILVQLLAPSFGALGHGTNQDWFIPHPVEKLRSFPPAIQITSGSYFSTALNSNHDIIGWGRGEYAVFGDGSNKNLSAPTLNESIKRIRDTEGVTIKKIKSCAYQTLALDDNGNLHGWGSNEYGQLGVKTEIGMEMYETANYPTRIPSENLKNKRVVDFDIAENISVILTDTNEVYWMGMRLAYEPQQLKLPADVKIRSVAATTGSVAAVTEDNQVYMKNKFLKEASENLETGVLLANTDAFGGGQILRMGGSYRNKYAIVKN